MFTIQFDHFFLLSQFYSKWRQILKLVNFKISANVQVYDFSQNLKIFETF